MTLGSSPWWRRRPVAAALLCTVGAFVLSYPALLGWTVRAPLEGLIREEGYCWSARLPDGIGGPRKRNFLPPDNARVLENGTVLEQPVSSMRYIANGGWGRFRIDHEKVLLSSSDDAGPSGRRYEVEVGALSLPENALLALWAGVIALWVWSFRCGWRPPFTVPWPYVMGGIGLLYTMGLIIRPVCWAEQFFESLWLPAFWAVGMAVLAARRDGGWLFAFLLFSLLPAAASYVYFAVGGASHSTFLVAGAIPWSDAWGHFEQAAQIGRFGVTDNAFNGRYFYPLVLSAAMWITGWNLQLALAVLLGFSLVGVALLCRLVRPMAGWAGTSLMALGCVLYLRENVAGICMTEALGFFGGVVGTAGLIVAATRNSVRWFIASLFLLSFGMAARPGALLVLPALGNCLALRFASRRLWRFVVLLAVAAAVVIAPFTANAILGRLLTTSSTVPFNNFAFSLHGMLLGKSWKISAEQTGWNAAVAMQRGKELFSENPSLLVAGYTRALAHVADKKFLFRFGQESRVSAIMTVLAAIGLIGVWFMPGWRSQAPWMTFAAAGLLLSLPFAPPWDAGERPYAVTLPMQCLMAGAGLAWISSGLRRFAGISETDTTAEINIGTKRWIGVLVMICALALLLPLIRGCLLPRKVTTSKAWPPEFRTGSRIYVDDVAVYRKKLATLMAAQGASPGAYLQVGEGAILGVDWADLAVVAVANPPTATQHQVVTVGPLRIDPSIQVAAPRVPAK